MVHECNLIGPLEFYARGPDHLLEGAWGLCVPMILVDSVERYPTIIV